MCPQKYADDFENLIDVTIVKKFFVGRLEERVKLFKLAANIEAKLNNEELPLSDRRDLTRSLVDVMLRMDDNEGRSQVCSWVRVGSLTIPKPLSIGWIRC